MPGDRFGLLPDELHFFELILPSLRFTVLRHLHEPGGPASGPMELRHESDVLVGGIAGDLPGEVTDLGIGQEWQFLSAQSHRYGRE